LFLALELDDGSVLTKVLAALSPLSALQGSRPPALGLGSFDGSDILIAKRPGSLGPVDLVADSRGSKSDKLLLCTGEGDAPFAEERTPPIRYRGWLFAGGSSAPAAPRSPRERALERLPEFLRRQLTGTGTLDLAFLLFLDQLRWAGLLGNAAPEAAEATPALAAAARTLRDVEGDAMPPLVAASRRCLLIARGAGPLWQRTIEGTPGAERARGIAITDAPTDAASWTELPKGALLAIDRDLKTKTEPWIASSAI
jgi:hypothetical protein